MKYKYSFYNEDFNDLESEFEHDRKKDGSIQNKIEELTKEYECVCAEYPDFHNVYVKSEDGKTQVFKVYAESVRHFQAVRVAGEPAE